MVSRRKWNSREVLMRLSPTESEGSAVSKQGIRRRAKTDIEKRKGRLNADDLLSHSAVLKIAIEISEKTCHEKS